VYIQNIYNMAIVELPEVLEFDWDEGNEQKNWIKHNVSAKEAEEPFFTDEQLILEDIRHSTKLEARYILIGKSKQDRMLFIVYTFRENKFVLSPLETRTGRRCYCMKKPLNLPEFKNEDEERDFWDKIDISEYFEPSDFKRVVFPNLKPTKRLISIRLPDDLIAEVKQKAKKDDIPYQQLIRQYIRQGLAGNN
jgi:uncharacterized DUF497 family protein/predicted DNA binding CopG/RHH family protein